MALDRPLAVADGVYADLDRPALVHALPDRLEVARGADGAPELTLALHSAGAAGGGGVFQARWRPVRAPDPALDALGWHLAELAGARMRIIARSPVAGLARLAEWSEVATDGEGGAVATLHLTATEAELMRNLALGAANPLTVELALTHAGAVGGYPFLAVAPRARLFSLLGAMAAGAPMDRAHVEAAFLSLPAGSVAFRRTGDGQHPGEAALLTELAARAIPALFRPAEGAPGRFVLGEEPEVDPIALRLDLPRPAVIATRLAWSFGDFVAGLDGPAVIDRLFPFRRDIRPFDQVEITALNLVPLDPSHVQRLRLDLAFTGATGTEQHETLEFRPGEPPVKRLGATYPALTHPFRLESKLQAMVGPLSGAGFPFRWPAQPAFEPSADPLALDLSPGRLGLDVVEVRALEGLFDLCAAIRYVLNDGARDIHGRLDAAKPRAWVVSPAGAPGPKRVKLVAEPLDPAHEELVLRDAPVEDARVLIAPIEAQRREPVWVEARIADPSIPYAVVELRLPGAARATTRVVRPDQPVRIALWPPSLFAPLDYEHRLSVVRRGPDGHTRPIETADWSRSGTELLQIA